MNTYEKKILEAWTAVHERTGDGASAAEVCAEMHERKTISPLDTVIDIADLLSSMAARGLLVAPEKRIENAIRTLGDEHEPPEGWEDRVADEVGGDGG